MTTFAILAMFLWGPSVVIAYFIGNFLGYRESHRWHMSQLDKLSQEIRNSRKL